MYNFFNIGNSILEDMTEAISSDMPRKLSSLSPYYLLNLGIVTGNPRIFQGYPDPYPPEPAPVARVGVLAGLGRGF